MRDGEVEIQLRWKWCYEESMAAGCVDLQELLRREYVYVRKMNCLPSLARTVPKVHVITSNF